MRLDFLLGIMAEALVILIVAKLVRDRLGALRGYRVNELIVQGGSVAAAVTQAGYLVGVLLGFLGAVSAVGADAGFLATVGAVALAGLTAIVLQLVADLLSDKLIFRGVEGTTATADRGDKVVPEAGASLGGERNNVALAVGKAAVSVATGLVLRGALSDPDASLLGRVGWFAAAQVVMVLAVLLYCRPDPLRRPRRDPPPQPGGRVPHRRDPAGGWLRDGGGRLGPGLRVDPASGAAGGQVPGRQPGARLCLPPHHRLRHAPEAEAQAGHRRAEERRRGHPEGISFVLASLVVTFFLT